MNINYQELYAWRWSKDANVMLVFLWLVAHVSEGCKTDFSLRRVEADTGVSLRGVRTAIEKMINDGVVTQETTHQKSVVTIWRFADYTKGKVTKATHKTTQREVDRISFVAEEHKEKWKDWLAYKSSRRDNYSTTKGAQMAYKNLLKICTITVTDYRGVSSVVIDGKKFSETIDYSIAQNYKGLFEPKNYGNSSTNSGRTSQRDAEQIAAQRAIDATQSNFDAEQRRTEIEAGIGLLI